MGTTHRRVSSVLRSSKRAANGKRPRGSVQAATQEHKGHPLKVVGIKGASLEQCVKEAQSNRVVITRNGKPVALLTGVEGLDLEQVDLGSSDEFWKMIGERRKEKGISLGELRKQLEEEAD